MLPHRLARSLLFSSLLFLYDFFFVSRGSNLPLTFGGGLLSPPPPPEMWPTTQTSADYPSQ